LGRLREEFWETRTEGQPEMWLALRAAVEAEDDGLRVEILRAAGLRPASLRLRTLNAVYDERGALYDVPMYCLRAPANLDQPPLCEEYKDAQRLVMDYIDNAGQTAR